MKKLSTLKIWTFIITVYIIFAALGHGCPIRFFTGISCLGCGMSRAYFSLLHLYIAEAFYFHPLFWAVPILFFCTWRSYVSRRKYWDYCIIFIGILFVLAYLIRVAWHSPVVPINISDGFFCKLIVSISSTVGGLL